MSKSEISEHHDKLLHNLGRLEAVRHQIADARRKLHDRAAEQLESIEKPRQMLEAHVERKGNVLVHRALRKMIAERGRLHHIVLGRRGD